MWCFNINMRIRLLILTGFRQTHSCAWSTADHSVCPFIRDLLDVCQAQKQFAPRQPLPAFGGPKGADVTTSLLDIQARRTALNLEPLNPVFHV